MISEIQARKYCYEDQSLIENYYRAIADTTQIWDIHHRVETIMNCGAEELIAKGCYYARPARELIFLTKSEHIRLHRQGKHHSDEAKANLSKALKGKNNPLFGKHLSEEAKAKIAESHKGKPSWNKGKHHSDETKRKMSEANKGKHLSAATRAKMSASQRRRWQHYP